MLEKNVRRQILAYLRTQQPDCYVAPVVAGPYGQRGAPDLIVCAPSKCSDCKPDFACSGCPDHNQGLFLAIETKKPGGKQSPIQKAVQDAITKAGGVYLLADSVRVVRDWFERRHCQ